MPSRLSCAWSARARQSIRTCATLEGDHHGPQFVGVLDNFGKLATTPRVAGRPRDFGREREELLHLSNTAERQLQPYHSDRGQLEPQVPFTHDLLMHSPPHDNASHDERRAAASGPEARSTGSKT